MPYNNFQMRSVYIKGRDDKVLNSKDDLINEDSSKDTKLSHVRLKHSHAEIEELRSKSLPNVDKFSKELSDLILMIIEDIFTTGKINQILNEDKSNIEDLVKDMIVTKLAGRSNQAKPKNETVIEQRKVNEDKLNISKNLAIKKNEEKKGDTSFLMMKEQEKGKKIITLEDAKVQEILLKNAIEISTLFRNDNKSSEHQKSNDLVAVLKKLAADIIELK